MKRSNKKTAELVMARLEEIEDPVEREEKIVLVLTELYKKKKKKIKLSIIGYKFSFQYFSTNFILVFSQNSFCKKNLNNFC